MYFTEKKGMSNIIQIRKIRISNDNLGPKSKEE
jgi:hypothetical protein